MHSTQVTPRTPVGETRLACSRARVRGSNREGAILLDVFIATLIFAICVIAIGQFGSQSLQLASKNGIERLAMIKAESALAKEVVGGVPPRAVRVWSESLGGIPLFIRATWSKTEQLHLHRVTIDIARSSSASSESAPGNAFRQPTVSLSRLVFDEEN